MLRELAPRLGLTLRLVAVDEGIGGYRDAALATVRRQAARWGLRLTVVAYEDFFGGWTMDTVARSTAAPCADAAAWSARRGGASRGSH